MVPWRPRRRRLWLAMCLLLVSAVSARSERQRVILDTDVGDDIDDAYAIALALHSPELNVLGITTAWGDTSLRARLAARLATECGVKSLPVLAGVPTRPAAVFSQRAYAEAGPPPGRRSGVDFLLAEARRHPHQVTLIALGPLSNVGAAIDRDPEGFRMLARVVLMGGSIRRGYDTPHGRRPTPPQPEYNLASDPAAAKKLLASGVPVAMVPLDATQWKMDDGRMAQLAARSTPTTDALLVLTSEWRLVTHRYTPTLYDAMAVTYAIQPRLCPSSPLRLQVDDRGMTRVVPGTSNASVCLSADGEAFFRFLLPRLGQETR
jgi:inosine-uridine nucleoside N-ribohydrolase